ncbi:MAG: glucosidase [Xanthobacteraceae bacterium]
MGEGDPLTRNAEQVRLDEANAGSRNWRRWGPYLSERQWGTVREDYSADGDAWGDFPHDQARSRAYRWGEDGLGGFCDSQQFLCLGLALWNGKDPILKERLFGLSNPEGNHGEDVKELYYYLDATPTASYARMLYKYPQAAYPYQRLKDENTHRGKLDPEFELIDTGIFDEDRYFDISIEYAKADVDDVLLRVTATNRGPRAAHLTVLPQAWFRNIWSWFEHAHKPRLAAIDACSVAIDHEALDRFTLHFDAPEALLFCENETNAPRLYGAEHAHGYFKDAVHEYVVHGRADAVNPAKVGTKVAGRYDFNVAAGASAVVRVRLSAGGTRANAFADFDAIFRTRIAETDAFYADLQSRVTNDDMRLVQRQVFAGMLWSKQFYSYDITEWLDGDPKEPKPPSSRKLGRNRKWEHFAAADVLSMPDKWEYPFFCVWDLAFHCVTLSLVDPEFAKKQLILICREWYMHPNGQIPAYEWNFGDVNPPVHAWAALRIYEIDKSRTGKGDNRFLKRVFNKLLINFTWWVNRKDPDGRNVFQGGFLGLDNIGCFDRSAPLPMGGTLTQSDGTSWMATYCLNMLRIALRLAQDGDAYFDIAVKFFEHFLLIGGAMTNLGGEGLGLWDEEDEFFYDWLVPATGDPVPLRLRSLVGIIPLFAVEVLEDELVHLVRSKPDLARRMDWYKQYRPKLTALVSRWGEPGAHDSRLIAIVRVFRMSRVLSRMLDENEFLSDYGVRAISRVYRDQPYVFERDGIRAEVKYTPGESDTGLFGGNSNWRGPIWMPINYLIVESLRKFGAYYGDRLRIECPKGSGKMLTLVEIADELRNRLTRIFLRDENGRRPVFGANEKMQTDPHFKDHLLFFEYFHGDNGRGVGASHQTGWTGLIANLIHELHE